MQGVLDLRRLSPGEITGLDHFPVFWCRQAPNSVQMNAWQSPSIKGSCVLGPNTVLCLVGKTMHWQDHIDILWALKAG